MRVSDKISVFFFPNRCGGCGRLLKTDVTLCQGCRDSRVHFTSGKGYCLGCGQSLSSCVCKGRVFFEKTAFPFLYKGTVKESIRTFKFDGRLYFSGLFARQMYSVACEADIIKDASFVVPVPMHPAKKLYRGFNQTELLAKELSKISGIPYLNALKKLTLSESQHDLSTLRRVGNVAASFEVRRKYASRVNGATVILVDDIITTNATLNESAKTLLIFGADKVNALAVAAAQRYNDTDLHGKTKEKTY